MPSMPSRCAWAEQHELLRTYHDREWGVPVHEDRLLFELLNLEGAQAGLSWLTVLKKRAHYQQVFDHFDADKIAQYDAAKKRALLSDAGIIRNRLKIDAVIDNAKALLALQRECGSFDQYLWQFIGGKTLIDGLNNGGVEISAALSKMLIKRGFRFVGPSICYAFMQAAGMIDDHAADCFRAAELAKA
jgi:DNA-3-methyladenine glycosylase I